MILLKGHAMGYLCTLKGSSLADECMIIEYDQSTWEFLKCCFEKKTIYINPMIMNFLFLFVLSLVVYTLMYGLFSSKNDDGRVVNIFLCKESIFVCDYLLQNAKGLVEFHNNCLEKLTSLNSCWGPIETFRLGFKAW